MTGQDPSHPCQKKRDRTVPGWPACLRAVTATCMLSPEAEKFSLGKPILSYAAHHVLGLREQKGNLWVAAGRTGRCYAILNNPRVSLKTGKELTPACRLPEPGVAALRQSLLSQNRYTGPSSRRGRLNRICRWEQLNGRRTQQGRRCSCDS